jgi:hypothetical protein
MDQMLPTPSHELPKPQQNNVINDTGEFVVSAPETHNIAPSSERVARAASAVAQAATDDPALVLPVSSSTNNATSKPSITSFTVPPTAVDANRIEKEWVTIAKYIVNKTKLDPRSQSSELSSFKHEYIKKRYGKEVK